MAKSQQEINYDNALKAKNEALEVFNEASYALKNINSEVGKQNADFDQYAIGECSTGEILYYLKTSPQTWAAIEELAPNLCGFVVNSASNDPTHIAGLKSKTKLDSLIIEQEEKSAAYKSAKTNYENAELLVKKAYSDWLEWKKANMTPSELQEFINLEKNVEAFGLRMEFWKWGGIIIGLLLLGFGTWYLIKRFR